MRRLAIFLPLAMSACAYSSQYAAPRDGRARAVWIGSDVAVELSGAPLPSACAAQLRAGSGSTVLRLVDGDLDGPMADRIWPHAELALRVPFYWGGPIVAAPL